MCEIMKLEQIVVELPIYGEFSFSLFDNKGAKAPCELTNEASNQLRELFHKKKIDIKCVECNKEYPFEVSHVITKILHNQKNYCFNGILDNYCECNIDSENLLTGLIKTPSSDEGIVFYLFRCTMNSRHYQTMYLYYKLENNVLNIRKIGQKPISVDLKETHSNEFKSILKKYNSFDDYRYYEQCASRNLLAGACTYLRRIFEKMVFVKLKELGKSEAEIKEIKRIEDKIALVRPQFDSDVQDVLNQTYGLLSKGIHELSNEEIDEFYSLMLEVINIQLESEKEQREKEEKRRKLRSEINAATAKNS